MLAGENYINVFTDLKTKIESLGLSPNSVQLIAVSKTVDADAVQRAIQLGAHNFAENRPEMLMERSQQFPQENWHFIGNIQSRQLSKIVPNACLIHSLFNYKHAKKISQIAQACDKEQKVLVEVNVSGEKSKAGIPTCEVSNLVQEINCLPNISVCGLMTMAPQAEEPVVRACFSGLKNCFEDIKSTLDTYYAQEFRHLSMGMSGDWRIAVEEGSTMVRIGHAIFDA